MNNILNFIKELAPEIKGIVYDVIPGGEVLEVADAIITNAKDRERQQIENEQALVVRLLDYPYKSHGFDDWYFCNPHTKIDWDMQITEPRCIEDEIRMPYRDYVVYLRRKYGMPSVKFFYVDGQKDMKVERLNEGLFLHHIAEEFRTTLEDMTEPSFAMTKSHSIYTPENFIYGDFIEHLLLHIKISQGDISENNDNGIDIIGAKKIWRKINKYWTTYTVPLKYRKAIERIEDKKMDYVKILRLLATLIKNNEEFADHCSLRDLAQDEMGVIHQEILELVSM